MEGFADTVGARVARCGGCGGRERRDDDWEGKARTSNAPGAPLDSATLAGFDADDRRHAISSREAVGSFRVLYLVSLREAGGPAPAEPRQFLPSVLGL